MEKTKLLTIAVLGLLVLNIGLLVFLLLPNPGLPLPGGPPPHERPAEIIIRTLKLDEKQQEQFLTMRDRHREKAHHLEDQRMQLHHRLFALLRAPQPNQPMADSLASQIALLQKQMVLHNFQHLGEIRTLLRPEQLPYYLELTDRMASFFGPPSRPRPESRK